MINTKIFPPSNLKALLRTCLNRLTKKQTSDLTANCRHPNNNTRNIADFQVSSVGIGETSEH